jgi:1-acyl-sn-glycerol-3-phosphate acyltransferase
MKLGACVGRSAWLAYWKAMRRYHRYRVEGIEHLDSVGPALIVGYHGRPGARDLCMLQSFLLERDGTATHAFAHPAMWKVPLLRAASDGMAFLPGDGPEVAAAVSRGAKIIVTPGGAAEGWRTFRVRYRLRWGQRLGYLRLALRHRLPIIPTAAAGADDAFLGLVDGYAVAKRLQLPRTVPFWIGLGPTGVWPLSLPFPVQVTQFIGPAIDLQRDGRIDSQDKDALMARHHQVMAALEVLLERARGGAAPAKPVSERRWVDQTL